MPERGRHFTDEIQRLVFRGSGLLPDVIPVFLRYVYTRRMDRLDSHAQLVSLLRISSQVCFTFLFFFQIHLFWSFSCTIVGLDLGGTFQSRSEETTFQVFCGMQW